MLHGTISDSSDNWPVIPSAIPQMQINRGNERRNNDGTETPAISRPNAEE
jgi:hypothetical protein